ncbi:unnamed protein product [Cyclocybe aegerita]|uniref:Uncharacterized protein n=1 Tax=Cyclocybe aegerita TaxID=1973307 RepID=A0A8S0W523_CYCAE|nr:unnamed protein product [Cyclocybe aegerita]
MGSPTPEVSLTPHMESASPVVSALGALPSNAEARKPTSHSYQNIDEPDGSLTRWDGTALSHLMLNLLHLSSNIVEEVAGLAFRICDQKGIQVYFVVNAKPLAQSDNHTTLSLFVEKVWTYLQEQSRLYWESSKDHKGNFTNIKKELEEVVEKYSTPVIIKYIREQHDTIQLLISTLEKPASTRSATVDVIHALKEAAEILNILREGNLSPNEVSLKTEELDICFLSNVRSYLAAARVDESRQFFDIIQRITKAKRCLSDILEEPMAENNRKLFSLPFDRVKFVPNSTLDSHVNLPISKADWEAAARETFSLLPDISDHKAREHDISRKVEELWGEITQEYHLGEHTEPIVFKAAAHAEVVLLEHLTSRNLLETPGIVPYIVVPGLSCYQCQTYFDFVCRAKGPVLFDDCHQFDGRPHNRFCFPWVMPGSQTSDSSRAWKAIVKAVYERLFGLEDTNPDSDSDSDFD